MVIFCSDVHNREAAARTKELHTLNKSMFAVHVGNPFTAKSRAAQAQAAHEAQYKADRDAMADNRREGYARGQRMDDSLRKLNTAPMTRTLGQDRSNTRKNYMFEGNDSDEEREDRMDEKQDQLLDITSRLRIGAQALGDEIGRQNVQIDKISGQVSSISKLLVVIEY